MKHYSLFFLEVFNTINNNERLTDFETGIKLYTKVGLPFNSNAADILL